MQGLPTPHICYNDEDEGNEEDEEFDWENDDHPVPILPGLFIGSAEAEGNDEALMSNRITHVLTVAEGWSASHPTKRKYLQVRIDDSPDEDIVIHLSKVREFPE